MFEVIQFNFILIVKSVIIHL